MSFLARTDLFRQLNEEEIYELNRIATVSIYPAGHIFYRPGEVCSALFLLKSGHVQTYHLSTDGRKLIVAALEAEALFGEACLLQHGCHTSFAEAMNETSVFGFNKQDVEQFATHTPALSYAFLQMMGKRALQLEAHLIATTFKSATSRLADLLLQLADASDDTQAPVVAGLSHEELADRLGVYRETVSTALRELKDAGAIEPGRKRIRISNAGLLADLAQEH